MSEPVSETPISLLPGKIQGISSIHGLVARIYRQNGMSDQAVRGKFPVRANREFFEAIRELNRRISEIPARSGKEPFARAFDGHPPGQALPALRLKSAAGIKFAHDSPLEGDGFEPSAPRQKDNAFRDSSFPTCARATRRLRKRSPPVQQLLLPVVDPVRMNSELTRQLGDRPVPPTAATTTPSL